MKTIFGATSTAAEVLAGVDVTGRKAIVTGGASGIGVETARALAGAGAEVTLAVRDVVAGQVVAEDIRRTEGNEAVSVSPLDLADVGSVDRFVGNWSGPLDILINNAGMMAAPLQRTALGWEMQFAVNHLGHFALATGLRGALRAAGNARVVAVSSSGHGNAGIDFEDPYFERRPYDAGHAYGQSKTANVLFAVAAGERWRADGITVKAVMPGGIWTNLQRYWDPALLQEMKATYPGKSPQQGAATSVYVATSPAVTPDGPVYYEDCHPAELVSAIADGLHGVMAYALDPHTAGRLWEFSEQQLQLARAAGNQQPLD